MNEIHTTDDQLRSEIEDLKRQLEEQKKLAAAGRAHQPAGPSGRTLLAIALLLVVLVVAGFFAGYLPRRRRESVLAAESKTSVDSLPVVNVQKVKRADARTSLVLPGNIQAVTE